ncbi:hypothetical protein [Caballeronia concitans]|uniref:Uncharacterized protein n=1 Tax=Caballeronia concitans TaxID=1777133 RepID=A0A658QTE3_9BURK|nr:hypothetical protein [Caballeronia concitans]KIG08985.1 hypothetical protein BurMR1_3241 [Burkholderia sp. MR1]SAL19639.1 hypothetical protein AWB72_01237 [Caballeronia concitans]
MDTAIDRTLIRDISRDVLTQLAPEELPLFTTISDAWFADPAAAQKASRNRDAALGFGADTVALFTPLILQVVSEILPMLGSIARKATETAVGEEVSIVIKNMFRRNDGSADVHANAEAAPALTTQELGEVHRNVIAAGKRLRLAPAETQRLADAVVAQFVLPRK